jgi:hypothetical protein
MLVALAGNNSFGPFAFEYNISRLLSWALFATSGSFTWPHHDAGGLLTYVICKKGIKLWSYLGLISSDDGKPYSMRDYLEAVKRCNKHKNLPDLAVPENILLMPGTIV